MILLARFAFLFLQNPVPDLCLSDPSPDQKLQKTSYTTFADYSAIPIQLNQGDLLVVYSDGQTEAENMKGDMFEEERLIKLIQENGSKGAGTLQESILDAIETFTQNRAQTDDITFLLTERIK